MKKLTVLLFAFVILFFGIMMPSENISAQADYGDSAVYCHWYDFVTSHPSRVAGSAGEANAADYIKQQFDSFGYETGEQAFETYVDDRAANSRNIIATKSFSGNTRQVVIGAHLDNAGLGSGAFDNGSGIGVLLSLAERFATVQSLPFNLTFVAFGAEEQWLYGSWKYVNSLSQSQKDSIILMINIDVVGYGDYNYVYGEDISNPQEEYFANISRSLNHENSVKKVPANMGTIENAGVSRPYYNVGHASDHFSFIEAGIPAAGFFSGNFDSGYFGYVEKVSNGQTDNIMHSSDDTVNYILENNPSFVKNLDTVSDTIFAGVTDSGFCDAVKDARNYIVNPFWINTLYANLALLLLAAIVGACGFMYYRRLQKQAIIGTAEVRRREIRKPSEEDIFKFGK